METIYAKKAFPKSISIKKPDEKSLFLAGPTPRSAAVPSWRPKALKILEAMHFDGYVFIPEPINGNWRGDYIDQIEWENKGLELATVISFWIPRDLETMPAFTTNIEFGIWLKSGKIVLGAPEDAPKLKYMRYWAEKLGIPQATTLEDTMSKALKMIENKY